MTILQHRGRKRVVMLSVEAVDKALAILCQHTSNAPKVNAQFSDDYRAMLERLGVVSDQELSRGVQAFLAAGNEYFPRNPGQLLKAIENSQGEVAPCHVIYKAPPRLPEPPITPEQREQVRASLSEKFREDLTKQTPCNTMRTQVERRAYPPSQPPPTQRGLNSIQGVAASIKQRLGDKNAKGT